MTPARSSVTHSAAREAARRAALRRGADAKLRLKARQKRYPLAFMKLWDNPAPKTSQRRALMQLLEPDSLVLGILGGNRSGKSLLMAGWLVANALGLDFFIDGPEGRVYVVKRWLDLNGLPHALIPNGPGECWAASPNFSVAKGQIRPHIRKFCPEGTRFVGWDAAAEAEIIFPNGGKIVSKAYRQYDADNQTWEGANVRCIGLDEQPTSHACFLTALSRLIDQSGKLVIALTPLKGKANWFYREVASPKALAENPDYRMVHLWGEDNPHIPQAVLKRIMRKFPAWQRAARERGEFVSPEGQVYPINPDIHVLPSFVPPKDWTRFSATDWGGRTPHVTWTAKVTTHHAFPDGRALEPGDLVVYRELAHRRKRSEPRIPQEVLIAESLRLESGSPEGLRHATIYRVADSEDPGAIERAAEMGWNAYPAKKGKGSLVAGLGMVESMLQTFDALQLNDEGEPLPTRPTLYFTRDCPVTIDEMSELRWAEEEGGDDSLPDEACSDHGPDCVRYTVQYIEEEGF